MQVFTSGMPEIDRNFRRLMELGEKKLARQTLTAACRVSVKAMKSQVPAELKETKKAIGFKVKVNKDGATAKAGIGVGIKKARTEKVLAKQQSKRGRGRPGVGASIVNAFWFILGTAQRTTGTKRTGSHVKNAISQRKFTGGAVHSTGQMKPQMNPVQEGFLKSEGLCVQAMIQAARGAIAVAMRGGSP